MASRNAAGTSDLLGGIENRFEHVVNVGETGQDGGKGVVTAGSGGRTPLRRRWATLTHGTD